MTIQPYLFFKGRCEEAINFYRAALDAKVTHLLRFRDAPPCPNNTAVDGNKVMHVSLQISDTTVLASDGDCQGKPNFEGFGLSLNAASDGDADRLYGALSDGGAALMPLSKTFFASKFGMVKDRFGITWMVIAGAAS
jgi:PhnB protein